MAWFKRKKKQTEESQVIPKHIAFIADGNGRWATTRGLKRSMGHKAGFENVQAFGNMRMTQARQNDERLHICALKPLA